MDEPSKDYAPTDAVVDGVPLGTFQSPAYVEQQVRERTLRQAAKYLRDKYGVTNRAAGDLIRLAELEAQGNSALKGD